MKKHSQEYVEKIFSDAKCSLLDKYTNINVLMNFKCSCGNLGRTSLKSFRQGVRCKECRIVKIRGKRKMSTLKLIEELKNEIYKEK